MGFRATPVSMAALATSDETFTINRGSNGAGIMYSFPNCNGFPYAALTSSGTSSRAKYAMAFAAAIFIESLISEA